MRAEWTYIGRDTYTIIRPSTGHFGEASCCHVDWTTPTASSTYVLGMAGHHPNQFAGSTTHQQARTASSASTRRTRTRVRATACRVSRVSVYGILIDMGGVRQRTGLTLSRREPNKTPERALVGAVHRSRALCRPCADAADGCASSTRTSSKEYNVSASTENVVFAGCCMTPARMIRAHRS